jgi:hypothetical protein
MLRALTNRQMSHSSISYVAIKMGVDGLHVQRAWQDLDGPSIPLSARREIRSQITSLLLQRSRATSASLAHAQKVAARIDNILAQTATSCADYRDLSTLPSRVHSGVALLYARRRHTGTATRVLPCSSNVSAVNDSTHTQTTRTHNSNNVSSLPPVPQGNTAACNIHVFPVCDPPAWKEMERLTFTLSIDQLGEILVGLHPFPPSLKIVQNLVIEPSTTALGTSNIAASTAIIQAFASYVATGRFKRLKCLTLSGLFDKWHHGIDDDDADILTRARHPLAPLFQALTHRDACPDLNELYCNNNDLRDCGARDLSLWLANHATKLRVLHLTGNSIGDTGMLSLAWAFKQSGEILKELHLGQNRLADTSAGALSAVFKAKGFVALEILDLRRNSIRFSGAKCLLKAIRSSPARLSLRELNVDATAVEVAA